MQTFYENLRRTGADGPFRPLSVRNVGLLRHGDRLDLHQLSLVAERRDA